WLQSNGLKLRRKIRSVSARRSDGALVVRLLPVAWVVAVPGCPGSTRDLRRQTSRGGDACEPTSARCSDQRRPAEGGGSRGGRSDRAGGSRSCGRSRRSRGEQEWRYHLRAERGRRPPRGSAG